MLFIVQCSIAMYVSKAYDQNTTWMHEITIVITFSLQKDSYVYV